MTHVELSLSGSYVPQPRLPGPGDPGIPHSGRRDTGAAESGSNVERWIVAVAGATEACVVVDRDATILAISASCCALLGFDGPDRTVGKPLIGGALRLIDFTAGRGELTEAEAEKIPPLLALSSERLARGLMRVQLDGGTGRDVTVDAISTPLSDEGRVSATLTFFSAV